jgi:hypothetical protein
MADWFIATEGVKVVKDSASLWPQIITAVSSAGAAFGGVWYGQWRITKREKEAAAEKQEIERLFISTELVFLLEQFASACCDVACDTDPDNKLCSVEDLPSLTYSGVEGDWRALRTELLYRIRSLPAQEQEARFKTWFALDSCGSDEARECARYQYALIGLKALMTAYRLRKICNLPPPREREPRWIVGKLLWRNRRAMWSKQRAREDF